MEAFRTLPEAAAVGVGAYVPSLPESGGPWCLDPSQALDPDYALHRDALAQAIDALPISALVIDLGGPYPAWAAPCDCAPCELDTIDSRARRAAVAWGALADVARDDMAEPWFFPPFPESSRDALAEDAIDQWLTSPPGDEDLAVLTGGTRGPGGAWAHREPRIDDGVWRRTATWFDLSQDRFGPTEALLLCADTLADQVRTARRAGSVGAFGRISGTVRSGWADWDGANLFLLGWLEQNIDRTPEAAVAALVADRTGLVPESPEGGALAEALQQTGLAMELATHPLGITIDGLPSGLPLDWPLSFLDPRPWDPAWEDRWGVLSAPAESDLLQIGQWGEEAVEIAARARGQFEVAAPALDPTVAAGIRSGLLALDLAVRSWSAVVRADAARRVWSAGPGDRTASWLRQDAATLDALAAEAEAAVLSGSLTTAFPADPTRLRGLAEALRTLVGAGDQTGRAFPNITEINTSWEGNRAHFRWRATPSASGSLWTGISSPSVDTEGPSGPGPASQWDGWMDGLPSATRLVWRACGIVPGSDTAKAVEVCSSDRVLHTPD